jgi:hypothetical protein
MPAARPLPQTLGELRTRHPVPEARLKTRTIKDEMRGNLIARLKSGTKRTLFPGIVGYEDTVVPQIVNAVLSKQNFILLGITRAGQKPHPACSHCAAGRADAVHRGLRDPRQSV